MTRSWCSRRRRSARDTDGTEIVLGADSVGKTAIPPRRGHADVVHHDEDLPDLRMGSKYGGWCEMGP